MFVLQFGCFTCLLFILLKYSYFALSKQKHLTLNEIFENREWEELKIGCVLVLFLFGFPSTAIFTINYYWNELCDKS